MNLPDRTSLHDYQKFSVNFIEEHPCAAILLDCGMGKSVISLTAIADLLFDSFEVHRILIIVGFKVHQAFLLSVQSRQSHTR